MSTTTVTLKRPIDGHKGEKITRIVLREPTTLECLRIGDPYTVAQTRDGIKFFAENHEAIESYLMLCIVEPNDPMLVLAAGGAKLVKHLKEALYGFFPDDDEDPPDTAAGSGTSPTSSSSGSATSPSTLSIG